MSEYALADLTDLLATYGYPCVIEGDSSARVRAVNTLEHAVAGELSFLANPKYRELLNTTGATAVLVSHDAPSDGPAAKIRCNDPYAAVAAAVTLIHGHRKHPAWGISPSASISRNATIGAGCHVGPGVTIDDEAVVGRNGVIYPGCYVGRGVVLGDDVTLYPNVVIYDGCRLGHRVAVHACSVIGEDGLGYAPVDGKWVKIPQVGTVVIEDDVEIGANCSIDRATLGFTKIGRGSKFSNLVAVGHGTRIGEDCMLVAHVGVAGSVIVGNRVTIAGQAGIAGHLTIGDDVQVGAKSGVHTNIPAGKKVLGSPAVDIADGRRQLMSIQKLPEMKDQLRELRAEVARLRKLVEANGHHSSTGS